MSCLMPLTLEAGLAWPVVHLSLRGISPSTLNDETWNHEKSEFVLDE